MTPEQLLTFAAVAELGSISRAAESLHLSQPAVSGQLRLLQDTFGQALYRREGRGIRLTPIGEQLATHARSYAAAYRQAQALRHGLAGMSAGTLALGASTTPASYLLPYLMAEFHRKYPLIGVSLVTGNTSEIMEQLPRLDLVFIEGAVPDKLPADTHTRTWRNDEIVAIAPARHPLALRGGSVTLTELAACPLVQREPGSGSRQLVEQVFAHARLAPTTALALAGVEGVKEAVRAGLGVGFVSAMAMRHEDGSLAVLRIDPPQAFQRRFHALVPNAGHLALAAQKFLELCFSEDTPRD